jgi:hypothetical protein
LPGSHLQRSAFSLPERPNPALAAGGKNDEGTFCSDLAFSLAGILADKTLAWCRIRMNSSQEEGEDEEHSQVDVRSAHHGRAGPAPDLAFPGRGGRSPILFGDPDSADTQGLLGLVRNGYQPFQVVALGTPAADEPAVPLLRDRGLVDEQAAAYVCRDFACLAPETEPSILQTRLAGE